jgi:hypothetical protein
MSSARSEDYRLKYVSSSSYVCILLLICMCKVGRLSTVRLFDCMRCDCVPVIGTAGINTHTPVRQYGVVTPVVVTPEDVVVPPIMKCLSLS